MKLEKCSFQSKFFDLKVMVNAIKVRIKTCNNLFGIWHQELLHAYCHTSGPTILSLYFKRHIEERDILAPFKMLSLCHPLYPNSVWGLKYRVLLIIRWALHYQCTLLACSGSYTFWLDKCILRIKIMMTPVKYLYY